MLRIPIKNSQKKAFYTIEDIKSTSWGASNCLKYGETLVYYITALTSGIESSNDSTALNPLPFSKARGTFQMLPSTIRNIRKVHPTLKEWSYDPDIQLAYFMAGFQDYMKAALRLYNAAVKRKLTTGLSEDPIPRLIYGFRLAYHIWHFTNYDKRASTKSDVDKEIKPLIYAANAYITSYDALFASTVPSIITRTGFNKMSFLPDIQSATLENQIT